jgi:hypothetical protein
MYDMYGTICLLQEYRNSYYISSISSNDYYSSLYSRFPMIWDIKTLDTLRREYGYICDSNLVENCKDLLKADPEIVDGLSWDGCVTLYESLFVANVKKPLTKNKKKLFDTLKKKLGGDKSLLKISGKKGDVYVHILFSTEYTGVSYGVKAQTVKLTGTMRIFSDKKSKFEYANPEEELKYLNIIRNKKTESLNKIESDVYGSIQQKDGKFRIHDKRKGKAKGLVCDDGGTKLDYIAGLLDDFKWYPEEAQEQFANMTDDELKSRIKSNTFIPKKKKSDKSLDSLDSEELLGRLSVYSMSKMDLCNELRKYFEQNDLLDG